MSSPPISTTVGRSDLRRSQTTGKTGLPTFSVSANISSLLLQSISLFSTNLSSKFPLILIHKTLQLPSPVVQKLVPPSRFHLRLRLRLEHAQVWWQPWTWDWGWPQIRQEIVGQSSVISGEESGNLNCEVEMINHLYSNQFFCSYFIFCISVRIKANQKTSPEFLSPSLKDFVKKKLEENL